MKFRKQNMNSKFIVISFIILLFATVLIITQPIKFLDGDEWTLFYVTQNFAKGDFSIDKTQLSLQRLEAKILMYVYGKKMGGVRLGSYRKRSDGRYIVEKSPGYFVFLSYFHRLGLDRFFNLLLALMLLLTMGWFCKVYEISSKFTSISLLIIFTPASIIMLYRPYMESFSSYSFLGIGGLLYLIADQNSLNSPSSKLLNAFTWGLSGVFLGITIFTRTAVLPVVIIFPIHFIYRLFQSISKRTVKRNLFFGIIFGLGISLFILVLLVYNAKVNGGAFTPGYLIGKPKQSIYCFSFQRLFYAEPYHPFEIIIRNLIRMPDLLIAAYPLLLFAIPGLPLAYRFFRKDVFWVLFFWFANIYALYLQFLVFNNIHYMVIGRLYLPAVVPLSIFSTFTLDKLGGYSKKIALIMLITFGIISYLNFLCQIDVDPFNLGIIKTFILKNWIGY